MKRSRVVYVFLTILGAVLLYGSSLSWAQAGPCTTERVYGNKIKVYYDPANKCAVSQVCFETTEGSGVYDDCLMPQQAQQAVICDCEPNVPGSNACDVALALVDLSQVTITCNTVKHTSPPQGCPILGSRYYLVGGDGYTRP